MFLVSLKDDTCVSPNFFDRKIIIGMKTIFCLNECLICGELKDLV